jgi:hypothetical protein
MLELHGGCCQVSTEIQVISGEMPFRSRGFGASSVASFASLAGRGAASTTSGVVNARAKEVDSLTELATWFVVSEAIQCDAPFPAQKMWQELLLELVW